MSTADTSGVRGRVKSQRAAQSQQSGVERRTGPSNIFELLEAQKSEIARALPKHMSADRLARIIMTTVRTKPKLGLCTPQSLLGAAMLSSQTGLEPGPLGRCYFVPRRRNGVWEVSWQIGYKGIIELSRRSGEISTIVARSVYEKDYFEFEYGLDERLVHRPFMDGDAGRYTRFYGVAQYKDGGHTLMVLSLNQVEARRARSATPNEGPWVDDYEPMARKSCIRAMEPWLPLTIEAAEILAHDGGVHTEITPDMFSEPPPEMDGEIAKGAIPGEVVADDQDEESAGDEPQGQDPQQQAAWPEAAQPGSGPRKDGV